MKRCDIVLTRNEIAYDVEFASWRVAKTHFLEDHKKVAEGVIDAKTADWLERQITKALSDVRGKISFAVSEQSEEVVNNAVVAGDDCGKYELNLVFGDGWRGRGDVMVVLVHDYIVNRCLSEWFGMVAPEYAEMYNGKAEVSLASIVNEARSERIVTPRFVL